MRTIVIFLCLVFLFASCGNKKCKISKEVKNIPVQVNIIRLEQKLSEIKSTEEALEFMKEYPDFSTYFLEKNHYPHDTILAESIFKLANNPSADTLFREVQQVFGSMDDLKEEFEWAFKHIKKFYPHFEEPTIYTTVTGFSSDLFVSDNMIVIGLDYFIGESGTFRPDDLPNYILRRYSKEYIVPSVILLMSDRFNVTDFKNNTMLAEMIFYGKAYYFTKSMMPCTPDSLLIGYTSEEMVDARANDDIIWANFIENQLLYETGHVMKNKFLSERPKVYEIGPKCPGRIGAWVGWEIVNQYMSKNKIALEDLMANKDVNDIFNKSKYRPQKK